MSMHEPIPELRLLFAGSPAIALPSLHILAEGAKAGRWQLAGILTNTDKAKGRSGEAVPSDVGGLAANIAEECAALGIPAPAVLKFDTLKAEARGAVYTLKPDMLVSFAYGRIFGPKFLALFPLGGINVHPSLLPKYRGASPIQEAIVRRDSETGVTIQRITEDMDSGEIFAQEAIPLSGRETTLSLGEIAGKKGAELLDSVLEQFCQIDYTESDGAVRRIPQGTAQQGEASYCYMLKKESGLIDWNKRAEEIDAQIRACNPWPLAYTFHKGKTLSILAASCVASSAVSSGASSGASSGISSSSHIKTPDALSALAGRVLGIDKQYGILVQTGGGILAVSHLQYQARKALFWQDFLHGARDFIGSCLGG